MSTVQHASSALDGAPVLLKRSWKVPVVFAILTVVSLILFVFGAGEALTSFNFSDRQDAIQLPVVTVPTLVMGILSTAIAAAVAVVSTWMIWQGRRVPLWVTIVGALAGVIGFLSWAAADNTLQVAGLLAGTITLAVPIIFGGLGGIISERVGVVNIAIEGQLLAGAFIAAVVTTITGTPWAGLIAAAVAGMLVSFVLAAFSIKYLVEQVIVGVVINVLVAGLTGFLFSQVLTNDSDALNSPDKFPQLSIPLLSEIPVIGPALFRQTVIVYLMYVLVIVVAFALYKTRWGLRLRAVGEHPQAADTVGINVSRTRFWNVSLAGAIAGMGGAFITIGSAGAFYRDMTAGIGFIALAAVIFGRWDPIRVLLAALLFGFASNLQVALSLLGSPVPSEFMLMLPYVVTIFAVAGLVGASRPPAASGKPYIKS